MGGHAESGSVDVDGDYEGRGGRGGKFGEGNGVSTAAAECVEEDYAFGVGAVGVGCWGRGWVLLVAVGGWWWWPVG